MAPNAIMIKDILPAGYVDIVERALKVSIRKPCVNSFADLFLYIYIFKKRRNHKTKKIKFRH